MQLRSLMECEGVAPHDTAVLFHALENPVLHRALPMLAEEEPDLFDAVQNQHGPRAEATIRKRKFLLSFVNSTSDYRLAGLYSVEGHAFHSMETLDREPRRKVIRDRFGDATFVERGRKIGQSGRLVFDLRPRSEMADLIGRLVVEKPAGRAYVRRAENLDCRVVEIARERQLVPPAPNWTEFVVPAAMVRNLPRDWAARLREWRGVYLIVDLDGQRYVGSAYGDENLLGRWRAHVEGDKGLTAELGKRNPLGFRFSILELVAPSAAKETVLAIEANWKERLGTRMWGLNRN